MSGIFLIPSTNSSFATSNGRLEKSNPLDLAFSFAFSITCFRPTSHVRTKLTYNAPHCQDTIRRFLS